MSRAETSLIARAAAAETARARARAAGIAAGRALTLAAFLGLWAFASGRLVDAEFISHPLGVLRALVALVGSGQVLPHLAQTLGGHCTTSFAEAGPSAVADASLAGGSVAGLSPGDGSMVGGPSPGDVQAGGASGSVDGFTDSTTY